MFQNVIYSCDSKSEQSSDSSEIFLKCWFAAVVLLNIFMETML